MNRPPLIRRGRILSGDPGSVRYSAERRHMKPRLDGSSGVPASVLVLKGRGLRADTSMEVTCDSEKAAIRIDMWRRLLVPGNGLGTESADATKPQGWLWFNAGGLAVGWQSSSRGRLTSRPGRESHLRSSRFGIYASPVNSIPDLGSQLLRLGPGAAGSDVDHHGDIEPDGVFHLVPDEWDRLF